MPARKKLNTNEAIVHLKKIYNIYIKEGGDPKRFTIRHYNRINSNSQMYIDVYVKKLGGWNNCLQKADIPLGFRQYKEYSKQEIASYVTKIYKLYLVTEKKKGRYKGQEKTFRMKDFNIYNNKSGSMFSLAVILKRFGSWSNLLRELEIPIGRSRGLNQEEIVNHVQNVYKTFRGKESEDQVFSKEMYDKYNFIDDVYISSKLVERRFGTWMRAKRKMGMY